MYKDLNYFLLLRDKGESISLSHVGSLLSTRIYRMVLPDLVRFWNPTSARRLYFVWPCNFLRDFPRENESFRKRKPLGNIKSCGASKMEICLCRSGRSPKTQSNRRISFILFLYTVSAELTITYRKREE